MPPSSRLQRVLRAPTGRLRTGWRLILYVLALLTALSAVTALWLGLGLPPQRQHGVVQPLPQLLTALLMLPTVVLVTAFVLRRLEGRGLRSLGLGADQPRLRLLTLGLGLGALTPALVSALLAAAGRAHGTPATSTPGGLLLATIPMAIAVALLSSWEEIALRGYPLQLLSEMAGPAAGAALTGLAFGLLHAGNPGANPAALAYTAWNGMLLAIVVARSGSLWLACGYHAGWNLMAALVLGLRDSGTIHGGALLRTELTGPAWLSGGEYGFEGSLLTAVVETLVLGAMVAAARALPGSPEARRHSGSIFRAAHHPSKEEPACPPSSPAATRSSFPSTG